MSISNFLNLPPVVVIGAGGHARVLIDCLQLLNRKTLFCTEVDSSLYGQTVDGVLVKGPDEVILELDPMEVQLVNGMGSIGRPKLRQKTYEQFVKHGYEFTSVIHPSAVVAKSAKIEDGAQIMARVVIQTGSVISSNTIINSGAIVDHDCRIEPHTHIAPRVALSGGVIIGRSSHIGTGANVIQGIQIGDGCVVGAGATVVKDLPDNTVAVGVPAKPISSFES